MCLDRFYSGLFSLKSCALSGQVSLLFSCSTIILYSQGCREWVSDNLQNMVDYRYALIDLPSQISLVLLRIFISKLS